MSKKQTRRVEDLPSERPSTVFERHGQSVVAGIALLLLAWVGLTVSEGEKNNAVMVAKMAGLESQVAKLEQSISTDMKDRYTSKDADRDFKAAYKEIDRIRDDNSRFMAEQSSRGPRIKSVETQVNELLKAVTALRMGGSKK